MSDVCCTISEINLCLTSTKPLSTRQRLHFIHQVLRRLATDRSTPLSARFYVKRARDWTSVALAAAAATSKPRGSGPSKSKFNITADIQAAIERDRNDRRTRQEFELFKVKAGDRVILRSKYLLSQEEVEHLRENWQRLFPGVVCLITGEFEILVHHPEIAGEVAKPRNLGVIHHP